MFRPVLVVVGALTVQLALFLTGFSLPRLHAAAAVQSPAPTHSTPPPAVTPPASHRSKTEQNLGGSAEQIQLTPQEQRFVALTNAERKARDLKELTVAPLLVKIAREKSQEMHDLHYWGHVSPVKEKRTAMYRVLYYLPERPRSMVVGENLCYCDRVLVEEGHKALMNSPTHRKNILNPEYDYIGIGTYTADDGRFWTTEIFLSIQY